MADAELELCLLSFKLLLGAPGTQCTPQWAPSQAPHHRAAVQSMLLHIFTLLQNLCELVPLHTFARFHFLLK